MPLPWQAKFSEVYTETCVRLQLSYEVSIFKSTFQDKKLSLIKPMKFPWQILLFAKVHVHFL